MRCQCRVACSTFGCSLQRATNQAHDLRARPVYLRRTQLLEARLKTAQELERDPEMVSGLELLLRR